MKTLFVIKDGAPNVSFISRNGVQVRDVDYYALTYGNGKNEGYIGKKKDDWLLYTQVGEPLKRDYSKRYYYFKTFEECITKLSELAGGLERLKICESEEFQELITPIELKNYNYHGVEAELNELIGLKYIKEQIQELISFARVKSIKQSKNIPFNQPTLHMIFCGNPGTGKTITARLISKIYYELGLISTDTFIEATRSDLVGKYIGHTAVQTTEVFNRAIGGVLSIDEAYSIFNDSDRDFGHEAISTLIKLMEDNRDSTVVILAGYTKQMNKLLESNPGLRNRFSTVINFPDYSRDEIMEIIGKFFVEIKHELTIGASFKLELLVDSLFSTGYFKANARSARNLFDDICRRQSIRLSSFEKVKKTDLTIILPEDIPDI